MIKGGPDPFMVLLLYSNSCRTQMGNYDETVTSYYFSNLYSGLVVGP